MIDLSNFSSLITSHIPAIKAAGSGVLSALTSQVALTILAVATAILIGLKMALVYSQWALHMAGEEGLQEIKSATNKSYL